MPKLSVIVPVYNAEKYLTNCIESILSQSFTDLELILVNDGSVDGIHPTDFGFASMAKAIAQVLKQILPTP